MIVQWIQRRLIPVTKFLGNLAAPWTVKQVTGKDYEAIKMIVQPGDIFLSRVYGHLSNVFIPGYWKHAAIMGPVGNVYEAIGKGVLATDLVSFLTSKDEVVLLRPTFCDPKQAAEAADHAGEALGAAYDYEFSLGNKAFYCAELVYVAYSKIFPPTQAWGFRPRVRLGVETVTADDFYEAKKWWQPVFDSRDNIV